MRMREAIGRGGHRQFRSSRVPAWGFVYAVTFSRSVHLDPPFQADGSEAWGLGGKLGQSFLPASESRGEWNLGRVSIVTPRAYAGQRGGCVYK